MSRNAEDNDNRALLVTITKLQEQLQNFHSRERENSDLRAQLSTERSNCDAFLLQSKRANRRIEDLENQLRTANRRAEDLEKVVKTVRNAFNQAATGYERGEIPDDVELEATREATLVDRQSRKREIPEDEPAPAGKRTKIEQQAIPTTVNPALASVDEDDDAVTGPRLLVMKRTITNIMTSKTSTLFRTPVDVDALNIPDYHNFVKKPMDLSIIKRKLQANEYTEISEFRADFELIVSNCVAYNGEEHEVTQQAFEIQKSFKYQMRMLPGAEASNSAGYK